MSLMSPSATCTVELEPRLVAALGLEATARAGLEIELRWHPNWPQVWRALYAEFAPYFSTLGGDAAAVAGAGAGEVATASGEVATASAAGSGSAEVAGAGATGAAVPAAVAIGAVLGGLVFIGGVMWSMANAAEEGRRAGLATWYIREYAVQFGETLFDVFGDHAHPTEPAAVRLAGQGRLEAREAVARLTPEQRAQLLAAGRVAVVREVASRLAREADVAFDVSRLH